MKTDNQNSRSDCEMMQRKVTLFRLGFTDQRPEIITLADYLAGTFMNADELKRALDKLDIIRCPGTSTEEKRYRKGYLPQAILSGEFMGRCAYDLKKHNGLMCIDIDYKPGENDSMTPEELWHKVTHFAQVLYAGHSAGGKGIFCIIPIAYPEKHKAHFKALQADFLAVGIVIDASCVNASHLRAWSHEPNGMRPYFNPNAKIYHHTISEPPRPTYKPSYRYYGDDETLDKVYDYAKQLARVNAADDYNCWTKYGLPLASLGEDGREPFLILSAGSEKFDERKANKKFDELKRTVRDSSIGSFFYWAKRDLGL